MKNTWLYLLSLSLVFSACNQHKVAPNNSQIAIDSLFESTYIPLQKNPDSLLAMAALFDSLSVYYQGDVRAQAEVLYARHYQVVSSYRLAFSHFQKSLSALDTNANSLLEARVRAGLGMNLQETGEYPAAKEQYIKALKLFEKNNFSRGISAINGAIGQLYQLKGDEILARQYIEKAMQLLDNDKGNPVYLNAAHTLANLFGMSGKIDSALMLDDFCISQLNSIDRNDLITPFYDNKANCYLFTGRFDSAKVYFQKCLQIDSAVGNRKQVSDTYIHLGILAHEQEKYAEAIDWGVKGINIQREIGYKQGLVSSWEFLSLVYRDYRQLEKALSAKDSFSLYKGALINERTEAKMAELKTVYETEKKDEEIGNQKAAIERQQIIFVTILLLLVSLLISAYFYYQNYKQKKEAELQKEINHQQDLQTKSIFASEQKERIRLARDMHDSIGQMLSVIKMHLSSLYTLPTPDAAATLKIAENLVDKTVTEVRNISHNLIPEELNFGLTAAFDDLAYKINSTHKTKLILKLDDAIKTHSLEKEVELNVYRIVQEVINNMLKHADASEIQLSFVKNGELFHLVLKDNGKGFDTNLISTAKGIGWKNLMTRIKLLNGEMNVSSVINEGTIIDIKIAP